MSKLLDERQVVLDTETTGINPKEGHKIIEIGCVELINRRVTNRHFHVYINPEREIDAGAFAVHGISNEFLQDKPTFKGVVDDFFAFVAGAELIIHNAPFDVGFLNHELSLLSHESRTIESQCQVFDTLAFARKKHPGARNNLDALCKRYEIDNSKRTLHGALLDAQILADVYLLMTGGQISLLEEANSFDADGETHINRISADRPMLKIIYCPEPELREHELALQRISKASGGQCVWEQ